MNFFISFISGFKSAFRGTMIESEVFGQQNFISRKIPRQSRLSTQLGSCPELTVKKNSDQYHLWGKDERVSKKGAF